MGINQKSRNLFDYDVQLKIDLSNKILVNSDQNSGLNTFSTIFEDIFMIEIGKICHT